MSKINYVIEVLYKIGLSSTIVSFVLGMLAVVYDGIYKQISPTESGILLASIVCLFFSSLSLVKMMRDIWI